LYNSGSSRRGIEDVCVSNVVARSEADEAIHTSLRGEMDCFAEPVIGRAFRATRWLAMTSHPPAMDDSPGEMVN